MKGLLIKDLRIILAQKKYVITVAIIGVFMALTQKSISFCIMYMTMIATIMAISTLNYDSYEENGVAYLMLLPTKRSSYVLEKYLFVSALVTSVAGICSLFEVLYHLATGQSIEWMDMLLYFLAAVALGCVMMSLMIPVNLKYGAEKSRVVMMIFGGSIVGVFYSLKAVIEKYPEVALKLEQLENIPEWLWLIIGLAIFVTGMAVSCAVSVKIIRKKEF